mgnify:CR=1 FL=1
MTSQTLRVFRIIAILAFVIGITYGCAFSQQINAIQSRCPNPNQLTSSSVRALADGNISYTPCPTFASIFFGNVDFSNATIIGSGFVSGTGTTNYIPRWTNGAGGVIGDTPLSWNGTTYAFNNTALNAENVINFTPSTGDAGSFLVGDATGASRNYFTFANNTGQGTWQLNTSARIGDTVNNGYLLTLNTTQTLVNTPSFDINDPANGASFLANFTTGTTGNGSLAFGETSRAGLRVTNSTALTQLQGGDGAGSGGIELDSKTESTIIGDVNGTGSSTNIEVNDGSKVITANSRTGTFSAGDTGGVGNVTQIVLDDGAGQVQIGNLSGEEIKIDTVNNTIDLTMNGGVTTIGGGNSIARAILDDNAAQVTIGVGNAIGGTRLLFDDNAKTYNFIGVLGSAPAGIFDLDNILNYQMYRTIVPAGTTSTPQVINKPAGRINLAAGAAVVDVTNSTVTTNSIVLITPHTLDPTCSAFVAILSAGSIRIRSLAACTGETAVSFLVLN